MSVPLIIGDLDSPVQSFHNPLIDCPVCGNLPFIRETCPACTKQLSELHTKILHQVRYTREFIQFDLAFSRATCLQDQIVVCLVWRAALCLKS